MNCPPCSLVPAPPSSIQHLHLDAQSIERSIPGSAAIFFTAWTRAGRKVPQRAAVSRSLRLNRCAFLRRAPPTANVLKTSISQ